MDPRLRGAVALGAGALRWEAAAGVPRWALDNACRSGSLVRALPGVFVDASRADDPLVRRRAALLYAGAGAVLSHLSALAVWGLVADEGASEHVTVARSATVRSYGRVVVHRSHQPGGTLLRGGFPVTRLERSIVESWPLLPPEVWRDPVIRSVSERMTTPARLAEAVEAAPRLRGRAELGVLVDRLEAGCRSALEIWGHDHVFAGPGMPAFARQVPVRLGSHTVYLDVFAERELVDFELDGATYHQDVRQRERDIARDAALAERGILAVRLSHRRLVHEPDDVRRQIQAILRERRGRRGRRGA